MVRDRLILEYTAKLAKEKGFDWKVDTMYLLENETLPAPTQATIKRWLREVHGIETMVEPTWADDERTKTVYISWVFWNAEDEQDVDDKPDKTYSVYEDADEVAVINALNYIK